MCHMYLKLKWPYRSPEINHCIPPAISSRNYRSENPLLTASISKTLPAATTPTFPRTLSIRRAPSQWQPQTRHTQSYLYQPTLIDLARGTRQIRAYIRGRVYLAWASPARHSLIVFHAPAHFFRPAHARVLFFGSLGGLCFLPSVLCWCESRAAELLARCAHICLFVWVFNYSISFSLCARAYSRTISYARARVLMAARLHVVYYPSSPSRSLEIGSMRALSGKVGYGSVDEIYAY